MPTNELKYDIQEKPSWRNGGKTTSNLLKDIILWKGNFDRLSQQDQSSFKEAFTLCMNIEYVFRSNLSEGIGIQTYEGTKEVLERVIGMKTGGERNKEEKETVNTARAFMRLRHVHQEMKSTGKLTVEKVCSIHHELLKDIRGDAGTLRNIDAYNRLPDDSLYFYAKPDVAKIKLYSLLQHHNIHMDAYASLSKNWSQDEKFIFLIKNAAWLMFHFMEIHPFSDANGRMGWLLANYVISIINPFPVHLYPFSEVSGENRQSHFKEALKICRKNPKDGPKDLAALLVEGIWSGWRKCISAQELRLNSSSFFTIVVQKSKIGELESYVKTAISSSLGISESEAVKSVTDIVERVDVNGFQPHQYTQIKIEGTVSPSVFVKVFP